ncbi:DUF4173 domain-containing protein [Flaviramulus sp. BrNp1-15]|uniref:DUF4153 domain-containing protein n=1 Tax=Flaviramulus sp. BrNp1-15 TaxID=2916754 RepID=UPI001EE7C010|nr:DUF4173 domain-containing protein [Flaviramulus sp. BrNp1-15]ULC59013.1 DUF4173 domain-containing protein [Flaviramulus sp. BrNp1-15]
MKKLTLVIGALLFSTLFYKQSIGLNLTLFSLLTIFVLITHNITAFKNKRTIALSIIYIITALSVFFYKSNLSIIANCIAFFTLIGQVSQLKSSIYINWLNGLYTFVAGFFHRNFQVNNSKEKVELKKNVDYIQWIKIIGIPLVVIIIFISLYKNGNPMFNDIISKINFSFINVQWLLFAVLGYYLLYNVSTPIQVNPATEIDLKTNNFLTTKGNFSIEKAKKENQLGFVLITLLNILIVFFLITDVIYLVTADDFRASVFSNQVHSGINALIASIIIAIIIILYFFRGNLNFYKANKNLKIVAYTWIVLNAILVINITIKDSQYIYYYGFTYKRIGVLIYLLLTIIGLTTTFIKVNKVKNFWYLLRVNTLTAFIILIISSTINWDSNITFYNLNFAKSIDFKYLIELSNNNTFILKDYIDKNELNIEDELLVERKYKTYINQLADENWQEINIDSFKINKD